MVQSPLSSVRDGEAMVRGADGAHTQALSLEGKRQTPVIDTLEDPRCRPGCSREGVILRRGH
jgi:hypothetical protein